MCVWDVATGKGCVRGVSEDICKSTESPRLMRSYGDFDEFNPGPVTCRDHVSVHSCKMTGAVIMFEAYTHASVCICALLYTWVLYKPIITVSGGARVELYAQEYSTGVHTLAHAHTAS